MSTSLQIFRSYLNQDENGVLDASKITSKECFLEWLDSREREFSLDEARKFRRALSSHLTGVDGRTPFEPKEEVAILSVIRQNKPWPCAPQIGTKGFRSKGFHERCSIEETQTKRPRLLEVDPHLQPSVSEYQNVLTQQDANLSHYHFWIFTMCSLYTKDTWRIIFVNFKYFLISLLGIGPLTKYNDQELKQRAQELCLKISTENPTSFVLVLSIMGTDFSKRILAQNPQSEEYFGQIVENCPGKLNQESDYLTTFLCSAQVYANVGKVVEIRVHLGVEGSVKRLFRVKVFVDPDSFLSVNYGELA